jgi:hypothetical protein
MIDDVIGDDRQVVAVDRFDFYTFFPWIGMVSVYAPVCCSGRLLFSDLGWVSLETDLNRP